MITMTTKEWWAKGEKLFGVDPNNWQFVCPSCGKVQTVSDFEPYAGAKGEDAYNNCISIFDGSRSCRHAATSLLNLCTVTVVNEEGKFCPVFAFAEVKPFQASLAESISNVSRAFRKAQEQHGVDACIKYLEEEEANGHSVTLALVLLRTFKEDR